MITRSVVEACHELSPYRSWLALPPQRGLRGSGCAPSLRHAVPSLDRLDAACEGLLQDAFTDGRQHEAEKPSLEVLAVADHDEVDVGRAVGTPREVVSVARIASPRVGVGGLEDDVVGIRPVVVQTFPDAARALRDVGLLRALVTRRRCYRRVSSGPARSRSARRRTARASAWWSGGGGSWTCVLLSSQCSASSPTSRAKSISASRVWRPRFIAAWFRCWVSGFRPASRKRSESRRKSSTGASAIALTRSLMMA